MGRGRNVSLAGALFTPVQQRVLALLFGQPGRRFQSAEVIRLARSGTGAVHRQLLRLANAGLLTVTTEGSQKYYQANPRSPIFHELHEIVSKTTGLIEPLRQALEPLAGRIDAAFVFGSVAKDADHAGSDIDLLIVSDSISHPEAYETLQAAEQRLGRQVSPTVMSRKEWRKKKRAADSFVRRVAAQPKRFIIGDENALA